MADLETEAPPRSSMIRPSSKTSSFISVASPLEPSPSIHSCQTLHKPGGTARPHAHQFTIPPSPTETEKAREGERQSAPEMSADELRLDLDELRRLEGLAKRPRVQSLLANEIRNVDAKLAKATAPPAPVAAPPAAASAPATPAAAGRSYVTLGSFSWDQDSEKIRIYVFLEGVEQEKLETTFKPTSVDIKFHDVGGKNYRCAIPKLNKEIVPEKCKVVVKPTKVVITLTKASKGNWLDLHFKEDKFKPSMDKEKDPMSGIMDLMKNMYEEGDEDMKRTIAKAWSDARSGKAADPMKGFP